MKEINQIWATGRRKTSIAKVKMVPGEGKVLINEKSVDQYFAGLPRLQLSLLQPLKIAAVEQKYDIFTWVKGGGITGQAEAIRHGISRALAQTDEKIKKDLQREGFLSRDPRMVERKKPGRPKARKRFQFSKR